MQHLLACMCGDQTAVIRVLEVLLLPLSESPNSRRDVMGTVSAKRLASLRNLANPSVAYFHNSELLNRKLLLNNSTSVQVWKTELIRLFLDLLCKTFYSSSTTIALSHFFAMGLLKPTVILYEILLYKGTWVNLSTSINFYWKSTNKQQEIQKKKICRAKLCMYSILHYITIVFTSILSTTSLTHWPLY